MLDELRDKKVVVRDTTGYVTEGVLKGVEETCAIWYVVLANILSVPVLNIFLGLYPLDGTGLFIAEVIVVIFETAFLKLFLKQKSWKQVLLASVLANGFSAIAGLALLSALNV